MKQLYGLLGEKLGHSLSPSIHSLIFEKLNLEGHYHLFEVEKENLEDSICGLKALGISGVNVTIPYKVEVMKFLNRISPEAQRIGAVNTISIGKDTVTGYNTDYYGLEMMFKYYGIEIKNKRGVILGTGGVAMAVEKFLRDSGINEITMVSRTVHAAQEKYQDLKVLTYDEIEGLKGQDFIINCTPKGMYPNILESPVEQGVISNYQWAIDLIYNPTETLFLKYARSLGVESANGLYMLVGQAVKAQEIWNKTSVSQNTVIEIFKNISNKI